MVKYGEVTKGRGVQFYSMYRLLEISYPFRWMSFVVFDSFIMG